MPIAATTELQEHLASIHACDEACAWAGERTPQQAWDESPRADWLLWWAATTEANSRQDVVRATCLCARRGLQYVPAGELWPLRAIEAAERWADDPTQQNLDACRAAARDGEDAAYVDAARDGDADAARAAARAADAPWSADAAADAARAAAHADAAANAAASADAALAADGDAATAAAWDAAWDAALAAAHLAMCAEIRKMLRCPYLTGREE